MLPTLQKWIENILKVNPITHFLFIMELQIGHLAYYLNLRTYIEQSKEIHTQWAQITYTDDLSAWNRLPLPLNLRGPLIGRDQVRNAVKQFEANVVFFNTQVPAALLGRRLFDRTYVISTDITPIQYDRMGKYYGHRPDKLPVIKKYKHRINSKVFQKAEYLVPWSSWVAQSLVEDYEVDPERIEVLPPGVDLEMWKPWYIERKLPPVKILFVGGDLERKGGMDLLAAFRSLPAGSAELILVTKSDVPPLPGVLVYRDLEPNSPDLIALYQNSDIFVLPSRAEAFGIAAVEASAVGLPVIATSVGGLTDIVVHEETGFLIQPGDRANLKYVLEKLIDDWDMRRIFGQAARLRAENLFDARKNSNRILEILLRVSDHTSN